MKKEIIAITGSLGSGKSSTANLVARRLDYERFSAGDFFRKIGLKLGMSLNEVSKMAETDPSIDQMTDEEVKKVGNMNKIVIDSRTAFHFIPESFKIFLNLPPEIAKARILKDLKSNKLRQESETSMTEEEIYQKITSRLESERKRFKELYGIEHTDKDNYDLVIDTDKNNLEQVVEIILREYKRWMEA